MAPDIAAKARQAGRKAEGGEDGIAPKTTQLSFIHWAVDYNGQNWGRNVAIYLAVVAATYGLMVLVAVTQIPADAKQDPSVFTDWAVMFAFVISLPAILFFVASDQQALDAAMTRVWTDGIVAGSMDTVERFKTTWTARFRTLNLAVQIGGVLLAIPLSYLTAYGFKLIAADTWALKSAASGYAYMAGVAVFYAILMIYIVRGIALAVLLKSMANGWNVVLSPLHPDGCGGLQPLGRIGLRNQYSLTLLGINIAVVAIVLHHIDKVTPSHQSLTLAIVVPAMAIYLIFGPIIFLGPLLPFRRVMGDLRRNLMQQIATPLNDKFDSIQEQVRVGGAVSKADLEALERLRTIGKAVAELPIWPFDAPTMRVFATAYVIPVLLAIATKGAEIALGYATK